MPNLWLSLMVVCVACAALALGIALTIADTARRQQLPHWYQVTRPMNPSNRRDPQ